MTVTQLPLALPTPTMLAENPRLVRGMKVVDAQWVTNDGAVLVRCPSFSMVGTYQWVGYYQVVFERDETNDDAIAKAEDRS